MLQYAPDQTNTGSLSHNITQLKGMCNDFYWVNQRTVLQDIVILNLLVGLFNDINWF